MDLILQSLKSRTIQFSIALTVHTAEVIAAYETSQQEII